MKRLLVVGGRDTSITKPCSLGVRVSLFQLPHMVTPVQQQLCEHVEVFDFRELSESLRRAEKLHDSGRFDAVVSFWEQALIVASTIGEALGIPCNPVRAVKLTRDKLVMRESLTQLGCNDVRFQACTTDDDLAKFLSDISSRGIVKPRDGSGSLGVFSFDSPTSSKHAFVTSLAKASPPVLVEERILGDEYSVESLSLDGSHEVLTVIAKCTTGPPRFIETGHLCPAQITDSLMQQLAACAIDVLDAVGHKTGPAHTEFRVCPTRGPLLIETHTRIGGDQIWEMVELVTGCDQIAETCAQLVGLPRPSRSSQFRFAQIAFLTSRSGTVRSIEGAEAAKEIPNIVRVHIKVSANDRLGELTASKDRLGYILAAGATRVEVEDALNAARHQLTIEVS